MKVLHVFDNNINYWKDRYNRMAGEKVVGHGGWSKQQYNEEYEKWKDHFVMFMDKIKSQTNSILDFGCGIGRWQEFLLEYGDYCGCDIIDFSSKNFELIKNYLIPFVGVKFDLIWTCVTLQHVIDDDLLENYIRQFYNRLKTNGKLIITENVSNNKSNNYISFRSLNDYLNLFKKFRFVNTSYLIFNSSNEDHAIMLFEKGKM